jgi:exoribonuclease II
MAVNVFYEEDGGFKVAAILADNDTSLQVEAPHGKRSKIKAASVLLRFERPAPPELMQHAETQAQEIDIDFLWQCCGPDDFDFATLGKDYYGHTPTGVEAAALLLKLHGSPMYFYKRGKGRYKAAPEEALKAALASVERKRKLDETKTRYVEELSAGRLPEAFRPLVSTLLYDPDKNSIEYKALEAACLAGKTTPPKLMQRCGAIASSHDYHLNRFLLQCFAQGREFPAVEPVPLPAGLETAAVGAFSIDDSTTTEIDDAFSVTALPDGNLRVGIHIAAPALAIASATQVDEIARQRLSTVYMPGTKITMLPDSIIEEFTLKEGHVCPAVSLYLTVSATDYAVLSHETRAQCVKIVANLRHDMLEQCFNETSIREGLPEFPHRDELLILWKTALKLEAGRGKVEPQYQPVDYNFYVENDRVRIVSRMRGSPLDKLVAELMIAANSTWGGLLAQKGVPAIYRVQGNGKVMLSMEPAPHQGLGVEHYAWMSSPIRRYVDLVNQRQLLSAIRDEPPVYPAGSDDMASAMRNFEVAYDAYAEFQRTAERYWCLRYLLQENIAETQATVLRESLVRLRGLPLVCRSPSLPSLAPGTEVNVTLDHIDVWELTLGCHFKGKLQG